MNSKLKSKLIEEAKKLLRENSPDVLHESTHIQRIYSLAPQISQNINQDFEPISWR